MDEYGEFLTRLAHLSSDVTLRESAMYLIEKRFDPKELRLPSGAPGGHGGEWGSGSGSIRHTLRMLTNDSSDLADELTSNGARVHHDGTVTVYHHTDPKSARQIVETGRMTGREDGLFFTTRGDVGAQGAGRGGATVEFRLPVGALQLDDAFGDEAHVKIPLDRAGQQVDLSRYLAHDSTSMSAQDITQEIQRHHPDVHMALGGDTAVAKRLRLSLIRVDESKRGRGAAESAMRDLLRIADENSLTVTLTPEPLVGDRTTSKTKLHAWYRRLGFVDNKGSAKDYEISEAMYRPPRAS